MPTTPLSFTQSDTGDVSTWSTTTMGNTWNTQRKKLNGAIESISAKFAADDIFINALDAAAVKTAGNQTIAGSKTFSNFVYFNSTTRHYGGLSSGQNGQQSFFISTSDGLTINHIDEELPVLFGTGDGVGTMTVRVGKLCNDTSAIFLRDRDYVLPLGNTVPGPGLKNVLGVDQYGNLTWESALSLYAGAAVSNYSLVFEETMPVGAIISWADDDLPDGASDKWKICDGSLLSSEDYPELYAVIGDQFGSEVILGVTHFNLPTSDSIIRTKPSDITNFDVALNGPLSQRVIGTDSNSRTSTETSLLPINFQQQLDVRIDTARFSILNGSVPWGASSVVDVDGNTTKRGKLTLSDGAPSWNSSGKLTVTGNGFGDDDGVSLEVPAGIKFLSDSGRLKTMNNIPIQFVSTSTSTINKYNATLVDGVALRQLSVFDTTLTVHSQTSRIRIQSAIQGEASDHDSGILLKYRVKNGSGDEAFTDWKYLGQDSANATWASYYATLNTHLSSLGAVSGNAVRTTFADFDKMGTALTICVGDLTTASYVTAAETLETWFNHADRPWNTATSTPRKHTLRFEDDAEWKWKFTLTRSGASITLKIIPINPADADVTTVINGRVLGFPYGEPVTTLVGYRYQPNMIWSSWYDGADNVSTMKTVSFDVTHTPDWDEWNTSENTYVVQYAIELVSYSGTCYVNINRTAVDGLNFPTYYDRAGGSSLNFTEIASVDGQRHHTIP